MKWQREGGGGGGGVGFKEIIIGEIIVNCYVARIKKLLIYFGALLVIWIDLTEITDGESPRQLML